MSTKHTPGPWSVFTGLGGSSYIFPGIESEASGCSVIIFGEKDGDESGVRGRSPDEARANARLIAAAPDLLEALRLWQVWDDTPRDRGGKLGPKGLAWTAFDNARKASIAKATGQ